MEYMVVDIESYYDSKTFTLKKMSMVEYIRDPRFQFHGLGYVRGIAEGWAEPAWVSKDDLVEWSKSIDWANTKMIGHNIKFDGFALREKLGIQPHRYIDTKGMSRAVLGKSVKNHSLATLTTHFGFEAKGVMKTDGLRELTREQEMELAEYCRHDVELTALIFTKLSDKFPENQYEMLHRTVQMFVAPKIELDVALLQHTAEDERRRKITIFSDLQIDKAVFASNVRFPKLLEAEGFDVPMKPSPRQVNEDGTPKMIPAIALGDPDFLDLMEVPNERLRSLCEARVAAKSTLLETRSEKLAKLGATGHWPFDVEYSGANQTHRFSGGSGAGGNPQNFTRGSALRKAVRVPEGFQLIVGDFANIELRLVAYLSKDPGLIEAIERGIDLYCDFASVFYGRTVTKSDEIERRFGKCAILGLGYGMGAKKFARTVRLQTGQTISIADAERAVDLYRSRYTRVPQTWYTLNSYIPLLTRDEEGLFIGMPIKWRKEALVLPSGLEMRYPNLRKNADDDWVYDVWGKRVGGFETVKLYGGKVLENISQGLAGELCKEAAQQFGDKVTGLVHDEIHLVERDQYAALTAKRLERVMSTTPAWMPRMKLNAEVGYGRNWLDAK